MSTSPTTPTTPNTPVPKIRTYAEDLILGREGHAPASTPAPVITETKSIPQVPTTAVDPTVMKGPVLAKSTKATELTETNTAVTKTTVSKKAKIVPPPPTTITASASRDASYDATIITDTKRKRFNLTSEVRSSISDWWKEQVESYQDSKKPKYTVPKAEHRKGVIQQATGATGRSVTQDHADVIKRIKAEKEERAAKQNESSLVASTLRGSELAPFEKAVPETITWDTPDLPTPIPTPTASAAMVAEIEAVVNDEAEVETSALSTKPAARILPTIPEMFNHPFSIEEDTRDTEEELEAEYEDEEVEEREQAVPAVIPRRVMPSRILPNLKSVEDEVEEPAPDEAEGVAAMQPVSRVSDAVTKRKEALRSQESMVTKPKSSWSHLVLPLGAMTGFVGITIVVTWYVVWGSQQGDVTLPPPVSVDGTNTPVTVNPSNTLAQLVTPDSEGKRALLQALQAATTKEMTLRQFIPTTPTGVPLLAPAIFTTINPTASADFRTNVASTVIGSYQGKPWIKIRVNDRATALGGMFSWEHTMSPDLNPLFGTAIRGDRTISLSGFRDSAVGELDVRTLATERGETRIVYGFIDDTTILITTDTTIFSELRAQPF